MLEAKVNLLKAIRDGKPAKVVKGLFTAYVVAYSKINNPNKEYMDDYKKVYSAFSEYIKTTRIEGRSRIRQINYLLSNSPKNK